ncbi:MAG: phosphoribosylanthranilate isomerase [Eubacteriales bacterium]|nr:phosphoribosylanthranilate isomerase [Eubacteriales bacterium]
MTYQTKIKVCGLRRMEDVDYVNVWKPDYIGFILAEGFRRQITPAQAERLAERLDTQIQRVGVFVNQPVAFVSDLLDRGIIQWAQLHGEEDETYIQSLREACQNRGCQAGILKAVRVRTAEDIRQAQGYTADYLLLDAWSAKGAGGNGKTFDWSLINQVNRPFFLAGGLGPDNVAEAIRTVRPYGVDASSSLETDGYKDLDKVKQFITAARGKVIGE